MQPQVVSETTFAAPAAGWTYPQGDPDRFRPTDEGALLQAGAERASRLLGDGVHTVNGDAIELAFETREGGGRLEFGFSGGSEHATVALDLATGEIALATSDWTVPQPYATSRAAGWQAGAHRLRIEKAEGRGRLIKYADIAAYLDGQRVLAAPDVNILPEIGVTLGVTGGAVLLRSFTHTGPGPHLPEYLHVGGWQMANVPSLEDNLASLQRGLREAAERGVQLLVTPETSLTGLYPTRPVTQEQGPVAEAERALQEYMGGLQGAPYLIVGLPVWKQVPGHAREVTRYNVSRLYAPDGAIVSSHPKIHSCETEFWHGYHLNEVDVYGVPVAMHICHDGRYPDVWTLPVMFGARLILHPSNPVDVGGERVTVDRFEARAKGSTNSSHAFYLEVNGAGGSYIAGPAKHDNLLAVAQENRRDSPDFPLCGLPREGLVEAKIRVHDAFGYWPVRSFRASEEAAAAYVALYRAYGGLRPPC